MNFFALSSNYVKPSIIIIFLSSQKHWIFRLVLNIFFKAGALVAVGYQNGSACEGACCQPWCMSSIPRTHLVKGENQLLYIVLWHLQFRLWHMYAPPQPNKINIKKINGVSSTWQMKYLKTGWKLNEQRKLVGRAGTPWGGGVVMGWERCEERGLAWQQRQNEVRKVHRSSIVKAFCPLQSSGHSRSSSELFYGLKLIRNGKKWSRGQKICQTGFYNVLMKMKIWDQGRGNEETNLRATLETESGIRGYDRSVSRGRESRWEWGLWYSLGGRVKGCSVKRGKSRRKKLGERFNFLSMSSW